MKKILKSIVKTLFFCGNYQFLPTVIFFWYSFFFLVMVRVWGPFGIIDNWFFVNFSTPGFALFNFIESQFDKIIGLNMAPRSFFYASTLRSFGIIFSLAVLCIFLFNIATIWLFRWISKRGSRS